MWGPETAKARWASVWSRNFRTMKSPREADRRPCLPMWCYAPCLIYCVDCWTIQWWFVLLQLFQLRETESKLKIGFGNDSCQSKASSCTDLIQSSGSGGDQSNKVTDLLLWPTESLFVSRVPAKIGSQVYLRISLPCAWPWKILIVVEGESVRAANQTRFPIWFPVHCRMYQAPFSQHPWILGTLQSSRFSRYIWPTKIVKVLIGVSSTTASSDQVNISSSSSNGCYLWLSLSKESCNRIEFISVTYARWYQWNCGRTQCKAATINQFACPSYSLYVQLLRYRLTSVFLENI